MNIKHFRKSLAISLVLLSGVTLANAVQSNVISAPIEAVQIANRENTYKPGINKVTFQSQGEKMVGHLHLPASYKPGDKLPAVVVTGAWTTVKEQMPDTYTKKLAEQGLAAFAFDFRYFGESGGKARQYESPSAKIQDIKNAVNHLQTLPIIDANNIGGLSICASSGYMAHAVAQGANLKSFVTVAAWLHDAEAVNTVYGGRIGINSRMQDAIAARQKFEKTGIVDYVSAYSKDNKKAAMSGDVDYYANPARGVIPQWTNRFAVMSWAEWLQFDAQSAAVKINIPTLMVHSDGSALPNHARKFYAAIPAQKQLLWTEGQHLDFYDKAPYVNKAVEAAGKHFKATLSNN